jgi:hypothetical protein
MPNFFLEIFREPLAQLVEQQPFKLWVVGSNPTRLTIIYASLSSSLVQDVALSRRKQGFESPQGRQNIWNSRGSFLLESKKYGTTKSWYWCFDYQRQWTIIGQKKKCSWGRLLGSPRGPFYSIRFSWSLREKDNHNLNILRVAF